MINIISKTIGIQSSILNIDNQSKQCVEMVCGLWTILTFSTLYSAFSSIKKLLPESSDWIIYVISLSCIVGVFLMLSVLYRRLLCITLFESDGAGLKILCIESTVCLINICCWLPNLMSHFVGNWSTGFSISELISMNRTGFSFLLMCMGLILILNIVSEYALVISCKRHRHIASYIFNI